jgi:hypothetical protein
MKVQKTVKHDSLTLKVTEGKEWVKLSVGRRGWKIATKGESMKGTAETIKSLFTEGNGKGMTYSESIDYVIKTIAN